jgi:hypothetical protein
LGLKENHVHGKHYWFCVKPGGAVLDATDVKINMTRGTAIAVVTGKFAHGDAFQGDVENFCNVIKATSLVLPENVFCVYHTPDFILQDVRFARHLRYHQKPGDVSARGGGYWIHKALLLRHYMDQYKDNDIILWVDADRRDFFWPGTFKAVLEAMDKRQADFVVETMDFLEYRYTKEDVLIAFNATTAMRTSGQVNANALIMRNSPKMRQYMDVFNACASDWHMISDEASFFS